MYFPLTAVYKPPGQHLACLLLSHELLDEGSKCWRGNRSSASVRGSGEITRVLGYQSPGLSFLTFIEMQFSYGLKWFISQAAANLAIASFFSNTKFIATTTPPPYPPAQILSHEWALGRNGRWIGTLLTAPSRRTCGPKSDPCPKQHS